MVFSPEEDFFKQKFLRPTVSVATQLAASGTRHSGQTALAEQHFHLARLSSLFCGKWRGLDWGTNYSKLDYSKLDYSELDYSELELRLSDSPKFCGR